MNIKVSRLKIVLQSSFNFSDDRKLFLVLKYPYFDIYLCHVESKNRIFDQSRMLKMGVVKLRCLYLRNFKFLMIGTCFSCQNTPIWIYIMTMLIKIE